MNIDFLNTNLPTNTHSFNTAVNTAMHSVLREHEDEYFVMSQITGWPPDYLRDLHQAQTPAARTEWAALEREFRAAQQAQQAERTEQRRRQAGRLDTWVRTGAVLFMSIFALLVADACRRAASWGSWGEGAVAGLLCAVCFWVTARAEPQAKQPQEKQPQADMESEGARGR